MGRLTAKIPPFEYLKGKEIVDKLKEVSNVDIDLQLADVFGVPKGTIGTWKQRDLTPYELIIRACLAHGVSLEYLALGKGEPFPEGSAKSLTEVLQAKKLENGKLEDLEPISFDKSLLPASLTRENCIAFFTESTTYFVNMSDNEPNSGDYVVDIDGVISINKLQRLPGGKVSIQFDGSPVVVESKDLKVIGRVALRLVRG
ncbi:phage repressor protein CI [Grimontia hollisae]|uniref:phage repressor protein CI n=1 Tax=Grimontia hollisae TaxID=673 RepID=UPI0013039F92|nr:phage repressor protein CI [Grimontia hollisae]MDF2183500.1 phage repressor protein CI [Grimontia hollisae]